MKVLLTTDVQALGRAGDVVVVADGYARNYLIPKKLAIKATGRALRMSDSIRTRAAAEQAEHEAVCRQLIDRLQGVVCELQAAADGNGHLYGSISERDIALELENMGLQIDRRSIQLETHIKSVGEFTVPVRLSPELSTEITVRVRAEEQA